MANQSLQRIYGGADISAPTDSILGIRTIEGDAKRIDVWVKEPNSSGDSVFQTRKNGTIISGAEVTILQGETHGFATFTEAVNDGDILTLDADDVPSGGISSPVEWRITVDDGISNGGGGGAYGVDIPPDSPSAENDEFDGSTLDPKWTVTQTGTDAVVTIGGIKSYLKIDIPNASNTIKLEQNFTPGSDDFSITAKLHARIFENYQNYRLQVGVDASNVVGIQHIWDGNSYFRFFKIIGGAYTGVNGFGVSAIQNPYFWHLQRIGGVYEAFYSPDGIIWTSLGSNSESLAITKINIYSDQTVSTSKRIIACDWIRRDWRFL